jgi:hypothetical protein
LNILHQCWPPPSPSLHTAQKKAMQSPCNTDGAPSHQISWCNHTQNPKLDQSSSHLLSRYTCTMLVVEDMSKKSLTIIVQCVNKVEYYLLQGIY